MGLITQVGRPRRDDARRARRPQSWTCASAHVNRPKRDEAGQRGRASHTGKLILVVDDEAPVRMICSFNLEASGLEVVEAADGDDALAAVRERPPDLVLLDVMMPNRDGWAVAAELH